jgi:hypothetical protein
VAAEGPQNRGRKLSRVLRDERLERSLINTSIAEASGGNITRLTAAQPCQDSRGREHYCTAYVDLRWRQYGLASSWSERFYLVPDCGNQLDAILRFNVSLEIPLNPESLPLEHRPLTEGRTPATRTRSTRTLF